jgi:Arc/MetJ-type ribon-helix-helix transcriptional regulator
MAKITVSVPRSLLATARRAVKEGRARSVSAYVAAALEEKAKADDLKGMLDEMLAETGGPMTAKERREAEQMVGLRPRQKRQRTA